MCPTEIIAFGDRASEFAAINTQVIAASCDSKFTHLAWVNTPRSEGGLGDMQIPIVADFSKIVATKYGVLIPDGPDCGVPFRALFIIDPAGNLRQITVNDLPVGRNVDEIIRLIKAFQFHETHGEVPIFSSCEYFRLFSIKFSITPPLLYYSLNIDVHFHNRFAPPTGNPVTRP